MSWSETTKTVVEGVVEIVASSPKVNAGALAAGSAISAATWSEYLHGPLAVCLSIITMLGLLALLRKNWLDGEMTSLQIVLLKHQVESMGATPVTEEIQNDS